MSLSLQSRPMRILLFAVMIPMLVIGSSVTVLAKGKNTLKMVKVYTTSEQSILKLRKMGLDIAAIKQVKAVDKSLFKFRVDAVVTDKDLKKLKALGYTVEDVPPYQPKTQLRSLSQKSAAANETVYHSFDEPGLGMHDQILKVAEDYPDIVKLETFGHSIQNRPLIAVRLTGPKKWHRDDDDDDDDEEEDDDDDRRFRRPEVLFVATHHAREWVAAEMGIRLVKYLASGYGTIQRVTDLLDSVQVWIVPIANPDGYEYTFTDERLWRKNLADNDGDGVITGNDGVDLNRNFPERWGLDDEGSSPQITSATYRGPSPASEPETQHLIKFIKHHRFKFVVSYHTYSNLILYPWGWQVKTTSNDDPIFVAQAGTDENPAIWDSILNQGYDPGPGADLYPTNGDFTEWTYGALKIPSYTVELTLGEDADGNAYGFEFPDDEGMVQTVFEDNLNFALSVAESAKDPAHPVSPVGIEVTDVYHTPISQSWGTKQQIEVLACKRCKKWPKLYYSVDGGRERRGFFRWERGEYYNEKSGKYFDRLRATVRGQSDGSTVTYRIKHGKTELGPFTYTVSKATGADVLILAAEDYTGNYPEYANNTEPNYLGFYTAALDAAGYSYDVYDVDAQGTAPSNLEVLSHYKAVIWYSGDDYAITNPGFEAHQDITLAVRDFINYEKGKLLATGQDLAWLSAVYGLFSDDFTQYYLGAFKHVEGGGMGAGDVPFAVKGIDGDPILGGLTFNISGGDGANNQHTADTFLATGDFLPHFETNISAKYDRTEGPYDPHSGSYYVYSQTADSSYKRLIRTVTLPAGTPTLTFWASYDIEPDWDYAFVEIHEVGTDNWTTLPDANGATTTNTGESCTSGWVDEINPFLAHYMDADCNPTGTTGTWNGITGNSGGWHQFEMDLTAWAGKEVEISITYASDWGTQGLGVFLDDVAIAGQPVEDFETGLGSWTPDTAPGSSAPNNWQHLAGTGFQEGPVIRTEDTVYMGFGFEAIDNEATRNALIDKILDYFGL